MPKKVTKPKQTTAKATVKTTKTTKPTLGGKKKPTLKKKY